MRFDLIFMVLTFLILGSAAGKCQWWGSVELLGSGGLGSLNVERSIFEKQKWQLQGRVGLSWAPIDNNNGAVWVVPVMAHGLIGPAAHKVDIGLGQSFSVTTKGNFFLLMPLCLGYRFLPPNKKYYLRPAYTPLVSYLLDFQWQHWGGFTFGLQLK